MYHNRKHVVHVDTVPIVYPMAAVGSKLPAKQPWSVAANGATQGEPIYRPNML